MLSLCTNQVSVNASRYEGEASAVRCKRWSCEICAPINAKKVIAIAREAKPRALLTLTVSSDHYDTPDAAAAALKRGLKLLRLRLKRHTKLQNFEFLAVFEKHESGYPHLHLLIKGKFIPWVWLRRCWEEITGSIHVDIRRIHSAGMAALYVAKYISKELASFAGCKRWWRSHGYSEGVEPYQRQLPLNPNWQRYQIDFTQLEAKFRVLGFQTEREGPRRVRWRWTDASQAPPGWLDVAKWSWKS